MIIPVFRKTYLITQLRFDFFIKSVFYLRYRVRESFQFKLIELLSISDFNVMFSCNISQVFNTSLKKSFFKLNLMRGPEIFAHFWNDFINNCDTSIQTTYSDLWLFGFIWFLLITILFLIRTSYSLDFLNIDELDFWIWINFINNVIIFLILLSFDSIDIAWRQISHFRFIQVHLHDSRVQWEIK